MLLAMQTKLSAQERDRILNTPAQPVRTTVTLSGRAHATLEAAANALTLSPTQLAAQVIDAWTLTQLRPDPAPTTLSRATELLRRYELTPFTASRLIGPTATAATFADERAVLTMLGTPDRNGTTPQNTLSRVLGVPPEWLSGMNDTPAFRWPTRSDAYELLHAALYPPAPIRKITGLVMLVGGSRPDALERGAPVLLALKSQLRHAEQYANVRHLVPLGTVDLRPGHRAGFLALLVQFVDARGHGGSVDSVRVPPALITDLQSGALHIDDLPPGTLRGTEVHCGELLALDGPDTGLLTAEEKQAAHATHADVKGRLERIQAEMKAQEEARAQAEAQMKAQGADPTS